MQNKIKLEINKFVNEKGKRIMRGKKDQNKAPKQQPVMQQQPTHQASRADYVQTHNVIMPIKQNGKHESNCKR